MKIKVLSVKNPFGYLICHGVKNVENRTWLTKYRGKLYIHASGKSSNMIAYNEIPAELKKEHDAVSKKFKKGAKEVELSQELNNFNMLIGLTVKAGNEYYLRSGYIIGYADLIDCIYNSKYSMFAESDCYNWILENPVLLKKPIETKGKLGIWEFETKSKID